MNDEATKSTINVFILHYSYAESFTHANTNTYIDKLIHRPQSLNK